MRYKTGKTFEAFKKMYTPTFASNVEKQMYESNAMNHRDLKDHLAYQGYLLGIVNRAREQYRIDKDLNAVIRQYKLAFWNADPPCVSSQDIKLAEYLIRNGQLDEAESYLDHMDRMNMGTPEKRAAAREKLAKKRAKK